MLSKLLVGVVSWFCVCINSINCMYIILYIYIYIIIIINYYYLLLLLYYIIIILYIFIYYMILYNYYVHILLPATARKGDSLERLSVAVARSPALSRSNKFSKFLQWSMALQRVHTSMLWDVTETTRIWSASVNKDQQSKICYLKYLKLMRLKSLPFTF